MNTTEVILAVLGLLGVSYPAYLLHKRGTRNDNNVQENTANANLYAGFDSLFDRLDKDNQDLRQEVVNLKQEIANLRKLVEELRSKL